MAPLRTVSECYALAAQDLGGAPPEWLMLLPATATVRLRDGRVFASAGAEAVVAEWRREGLDLPVDLNHAEVYSAPYGGDSPAYGWVTAMEVREGAVFGRVEWTPEGRETITARRYRYYSPTFLIAARATGRREIVGITSVALVNRPALPEVSALAREDNNMDNKDRIRAALGLADDATEQQVLDAIAGLRQPPAAAPAQQRQSGTPASGTAAGGTPAAGAAPAAGAGAGADGAGQGQGMVPLADYQLVAARARTAEESLRTRAEADLTAEAAAAVDGAIEARKIAPMSRDYHLEGCRSRADIDRFKAFAAAAPAMLQEQAAAGAQPNEAGADRRTPEQIEVDRQLGVDGSAEPQDGARA